MSHVRTQIRNRVAVLVASVGTVFKSRSYPVAETTLPVVLVYTNAEQLEADVEAFGALDRLLEVVVEPIVQATADVDTALDDKIAAVESAIAADMSLAGLALHCRLSAIEITVSTEGAQPIGRARMTYEAHYRTSFTDPHNVI